MSLIDSLNYAPKVGAVQSKSMKVVVKPSSGGNSFTAGNVISFDIPCMRKNQFLDGSHTYLSFRAVTSSAANLDGSAGSCFSTQTLWSAEGVLLEQFQNHNVLYNALLDYTVGIPQRVGSLSGNLGCGDSFVPNNAAAAAPSNSSFRSGVSLATTSATATPLNMPLMGWLGLHADKYIPVGEMNGLRLDMQVCTADALALVTSGATNPTITLYYPELHLTYVEVSQEAGDAIRASTGGVFQIHGSSFRSFSNTLPSGTSGTWSMLVSARNTSLNALLTSIRLSSDLTAYTSLSSTGRIMGKISQFSARVGSAGVFPSKPIDCINSGGNGNAWSETIKAFHALDNGIWNTSVTSAGFYTTADNTAVTSGSSSGTLLGIELQSFSHKNGSIMSGINTLQGNSYIDFVLSGATSANYQVDVFSWYDALLHIENGIVTVVQ